MPVSCRTWLLTVCCYFIVGGPPAGIVAARHHIRVWKQAVLYDGREVWVGAATHDIAVSNARKGTKWSHRVDSHIDRERDWIQSDLLFAGTAVGYANVDRPAAPKKLSNAIGDDMVTDGKMAVVVLKKNSSDGLKTRASATDPSQ